MQKKSMLLQRILAIPFFFPELLVLAAMGNSGSIGGSLEAAACQLACQLTSISFLEEVFSVLVTILPFGLGDTTAPTAGAGAGAAVAKIIHFRANFFRELFSVCYVYVFFLVVVVVAAAAVGRKGGVCCWRCKEL